jgi:hypothetical protein
MIEVEGKIINRLATILIDSIENHNYVDPKLEGIFHLKKSKLERSWLI